MTADDLIASALEALAGNRHRRSDAVDLVARSAGLYAFYGDDQSWLDLSQMRAFEDQPLYVGKAERSLN